MNKTLEAFLRENNILFSCSREEDRRAYFFHLDTKDGTLKGVIGDNDLENYVLIYLVCSIEIPKSREEHILKFISKINWEDPFGAFIYDFQDNIVGYHTSFIKVKSTSENAEKLNRLFNQSKDRFEFYFSGILQTAFSEKKVDEILNQLEFNTNPILN